MADPFDRDSFPAPQDDFGVQNPYVSPIAEEVRSEANITRSAEPLNPWVSMWTKPRATVRQQLDTDPTRQVLLLAALGGVAGQVANNASALSADVGFRVMTFAGLLLMGAALGIVWLYVGGWLIGMAGRMIGGFANALECRTALAWSAIPGIWMLPINLVIGLYYIAVGPDAIRAPAADPVPPPMGVEFSVLPPWILGVMILGGVIGIWQLVITCMAVGEAHQFSSLRGFGTLLLAMLAMMGVFIGVSLVVGVIVAVMSMAFG